MDGLDRSSASLSSSNAQSDYNADHPAVEPHPAWAQALSDASTADEGAAKDLIGGATDATTGKVDTGKLAQLVADAAAHDPGKASAAYSAVHAQLQKSDPGAAAQFDQNVARAFSDVSKGTAPGVYRAGREVLKSNPILTKEWVFTRSAWTNKGGATDGLSNLLARHGIRFDDAVRSSPANSLDRKSGVDSARANNTNGGLARDAIADEYRAQGQDARTEVKTQVGARRVDVQVHEPAADPRYSRTREIESKVGRAGLDSEIRSQVANDAKALAENGEVRGLGHALEGAGKILGPVAVAADAVQLGQAIHQDGNTIGNHTARAAAGIAGGWGGALAGAEAGSAAGAALGSVVPVVGTAVGAAVGAIAGGIAGGVSGDWAGRHLYDEVKNIL